MNRRWARSVLALVVLAASAYAIWHFFWREQPVTYAIEAVELSRGTIERSISATGSVEALVTADVSSQLSGQISVVNVDFNSQVTREASLAEIDRRSFEARVASSEAALAIAKSNVAVQEANAAKARALLEMAERAVDRQRRLVASNATAAATLDTAETQMKTTGADLQIAEAQLANARANVTQGESDLAEARLDLDRTHIRSPIDGVVIARNIDPGGTVAASLQAPILFQIAQDLKQIQILVLVDEADIGAIETDQPVTFTVDAFPDASFSGKVAQVRIAGATTNNVVTYTVVVRAENPQQKLLPGMTATVRIITGTRRDVLRIPNEAIRFTPPSGVRTTEPAERPNRDDAIVAYFAEKLGLADEQTEQFRAAMAATRRDREQTNAAPRGEEADEQDDDTSTQVSARRGVRARTVSGGEAERRGRIARILEGILTAEQMKAFQALRDEWRETTRPANVWTQAQNGLQPHRLLLGLSDESFSEVLRGALEQGDRVVTRARRNGGSGNQPQGRGSR